MLWKILSGLSAVALGVGLWFSYQNQGALKEELAQKGRAEQNLKAVKQAQEEAVEANTKKKKELEDLTKQRDDTKVEVTKVNADHRRKAEGGRCAEEDPRGSPEAARQDERGDPQGGRHQEAHGARSRISRKQVKDSEAAIANQEQQLALSQEKLGKVTGQIAHVKELDSRQKRGQVDPSFSARVAQPFPDYGFVVLNKGNLGGVFANAMLDVRRGKSIIARLKVRDVEQGSSVADLVPGSLAKGESIRSGDLVVAAPLPPPPVEPAPAHRTSRSGRRGSRSSRRHGRHPRRAQPIPSAHAPAPGAPARPPRARHPRPAPIRSPRPPAARWRRLPPAAPPPQAMAPRRNPARRIPLPSNSLRRRSSDSQQPTFIPSHDQSSLPPQRRGDGGGLLLQLAEPPDVRRHPQGPSEDRPHHQHRIHQGQHRRQ